MGPYCASDMAFVYRMTQLFISDLHLSEQRPDLTQAFLHFLRIEAVKANKLFILGDLFEFWIGDDEQSPLQQKISQALRDLNEVGCQIFFIHGNRDFMIGYRFANESGCTLLPEIYQTTVAGQQSLLLHGDLLCTEDRDYQRFRKITQWKWLRWIFLKLPLSRRIRIAEKIRRGSKAGKQQKSQQIMDVTPSAVESMFNRYQIAIMIHGHTHRPATHDVSLPNMQTGQRIVLGDWDSHIWYLKDDGHKITQIAIPVPLYIQENK